ncbi:MAG: hypothetical protein M0R22_04385 [Dehalococcoidia bacterium]|jgi:hypothetical protein|nr:hypothetical protein [Dehalococcoidia bacterium]
MLILQDRMTHVLHFEFGRHQVAAIWHDWADAHAAIRRAIDIIKQIAAERSEEIQNQECEGK